MLSKLLRILGSSHILGKAFFIGSLTKSSANIQAGAPSALGKILAKALADVPSSFCTYYMDDVLVYSKDPWSHIKHLAVVLKAILHFGLKLRLDKCNFFRNQIEFLGHNITKDRYAIIKSYIEPITDWPLVA